jgi:hypothetical protein
MKPYKYILNGHEPMLENDFMRWATWFEDADRHVRDSFQGDMRVSTVFLGLDHNFADHGPPILFETMAFIGHNSISCERYSTWAEAEEGHKRHVAEVFKATPILTLPGKDT